MYLLIIASLALFGHVLSYEKSDNDLTISVYPSESVVIGYDDRLEIGCDYTGKGPIKYLAIKKSTYYGASLQCLYDASNGTVSEHLKNTGAMCVHSNPGKESEARLTLTFSAPTVRQRGRYFCKVVRNDDSVVHTERDVQVKYPTVRFLAKQLRNLHRKFEERLECETNRIDSILNIYQNALFNESGVFQGSNYIISEYSPASYTQAEQVCNDFGGFLAEVDTLDEYEFLQEFVGGTISEQQIVLLGATDDLEEGTFINRQSGTPAAVLDFFNGQPDNFLGENCLSLILNFQNQGGVRMNDIRCTNIPFRSEEWVHAFLCEIPVGEDIRDQQCPTKGPK